MRHFGISSAPFYPRGAEKPRPVNAPPSGRGNFHKTSRPASGAQPLTGSPGADTHTGLVISFPFPPGSIREDPARAVLETPQLSNPFLDVVVGGLLGLALFIVVIFLFVQA